MSARACTLAAALLATALLGAPGLAGPGAAGQTDQDVLLAAIRTEVGRAAARLRLGELPPPYLVEVAVTDQAVVEVQASFGALVAATKERSRPLAVSVRVGSLELDSSEYVAGSRSFSSGGAPGELPVDDHPIALRHDVWLALDVAYKQALELLASKSATLANRLEADPLPDLARQTPVTALAPRLALDPDLGPWRDAARRLSAVFRAYPAIQESTVRLRVQVANRYLVNSEGTVVRQPRRRAMLLVQAATQAGDGMALRHFLPVFAQTLEDLPPERELEARLRGMADELTALAAAPVLEPYIGPVLFAGQAAPELLAQVLAPELSGHRPPLFEEEAMSSSVPRSSLADRLGRLVLPRFLSALDDPTLAASGGEPLIGGFAFDDEGVPAARVSLVEAGRLRTVLMTRRPRKDIAASNGHARTTLLGSVTAHVANLVVSAEGGVAQDELERLLLAQAREAGLPFGLLVTLVEDGGVLAGGDAPWRSLRLSRHSLADELAPPVLVYRVWADDGRHELVRGAAFSGLDVRTLREIAAAGDRQVVDNRLSLTLGNPYAMRSGGLTDLGIPCAVVAPALLLPDVEVIRSPSPRERPALLPHPFFAFPANPAR